jgi:hypothetical protein
LAEANHAYLTAACDVWGWRARIRLSRGQTVTDVIVKIPALESAVGTFRGAVRAYPTTDDLQSKFAFFRSGLRFPPT